MSTRKRFLLSVLQKSRNLFIFVFLISLFSGVAIHFERRCQTFSKNDKKCQIAKLIHYPGRVFYKGLTNSYDLIKNFSLMSEFSVTGELARYPLETAKRFKDLEPGFNFYYKKRSKPNFGLLVLSRINPKGGNPALEIWDLNEQTLINSYNFDFKDIKKLADFKNAPELEFQHPLILEDGSIIVVGSAGEEPILKFDKCANLLKSNNDYKFHHSIEKDKDGLIYVPIHHANKDSLKYQNAEDFMDHGFAILDKELNVIKVFSLLDIYEKNGLISDVYGRHEHVKDPFHLNDVQPIVREDGSKVVLLSLRHQSALIALDIQSEKILWLIEQASSLQHDIDVIKKDGNIIDISFFDNNVRQYLKPYTTGNQFVKFKSLDISPNLNTELISEPNSHKKYGIKRFSFKNIQEKYVPKTITEGRADLNKKYNSVFLEETNMGRLMEVDLKSGKILWQYVNKSSKDGIPFYMSWSRRIEKDSLNADFDSCINQ